MYNRQYKKWLLGIGTSSLRNSLKETIAKCMWKRGLKRQGTCMQNEGTAGKYLR